MAFASSRIEAQEIIIKPCDLCEDDENVNWFCKDCFQNLCDRCRKSHQRSYTCKNHCIVSVLEGYTITRENVSDVLVCQEHNQPFNFFCRTCEKNVCSTCLSRVHNDHDFKDHRDLHSELERSLKDAITQKEDEKRQINKNIEELEKCANDYTDKLTKSYDSIDDRIKAIRAAVDEEGEKIKKSLKSSTDRQITKVEERKQKLIVNMNEYDDTIQKVNRKLTLQTTSTFNEFVKASLLNLRSLNPVKSSIPLIDTFTVGDSINKDALREMICKSWKQQNTPESNVRERKIIILAKLEIVHIYRPAVQNCQNICSSRNGSVWIVGRGCVYYMSADFSTVLLKKHSERYRLNTHIRAVRDIVLLMFPVHAFYSYDLFSNIACLQSGDAVVHWMIGNSSFIEIFTTDGRIILFNHLPLASHVTAIRICNDDKVVVSVVESQGWFSTTSSLVLFSNEGEKLSTMHLDKGVEGVCVNKDDNFVTSDINQRNLTTLDSRGDTLKKMPISKHTLRQMVCDRYGNILGVPHGEDVKEVYLVSDDGNIERSFPVECKKYINDITINHENCLLILVDGEKVIVAKYIE